MTAELLQCPHCTAVFRIPAGAERIGHVRCGNCAGVFIGDDYSLPPPTPRQSDDAAPGSQTADASASPEDATTEPSAEAPGGLPLAEANSEEPQTLDLSQEASDFFLDNQIAAGMGAPDDFDVPLDDPDLPGLEETLVMRVAQNPATPGANSSDDAESAARDTDDALSAEEGIDDALLADMLSDLPDAEATLALGDPLLDDVEDSVESIDLSPFGDVSGEWQAAAEESLGAPDTMPPDATQPPEEPGTAPLDGLEDDLTEQLALTTGPDDDEAALSEPTIDLSREEMATLELPITPTAADEGPAETGQTGPEQMTAAPPLVDPTVTDDQAAHPQEHAPGSTRQADAAPTDELPPLRGGGAVIGWSVAALLLLGLLGVQAVYAFRGDLQARPAYRPYVSQLCGVLGCELPPLRDLSQIAIFGRHVESHPSYSGALLVNATIVNRAPFSQPYPDILLRFSDAQGAPYAERVFTPDEYLRAPLVDPDRFASEVPVKLVLELLDPGPGAVRYDFKFL